MSGSNGVIRIGRKGMRKFAIGDEDDPRCLPVFEVDVVVAFQRWLEIDDGFRPAEEDKDGLRMVAQADMPAYHAGAVAFVKELGGGDVTVAEALDFIARLREQYDELAHFFRPRSREERSSPGSSAAPSATLQFLEEPAI